MPKLIVADENEGRRNLLANTLERAGFEVTRAGTLRQAEGTALATMPEVVLIDGEWKISDAIDASQRLMTDPEFAFKCRIVVLSRNSGQEYLVSAAQAGISEVISKPIDMSLLIEQLNKHARKQFVPPPADVAGPNSGGGSFDVSMLMGDSTWALPMLKGLVSPEKINPDFIDEILNFADEKEMTENSKNQGDKDELYNDAVEIIRSEGKASTSFLQRKLQIGYNRAARIIDMMEADGIVSKANHVGKRDVL